MILLRNVSRLLLLSSIFLILSFMTSCATSRVVSLDTRSGAKQQISIIKPENPIAAIVLFYGGDDVVRGKMNPSFPAKGREYFLRHGIVPVLVYIPSDRNELDHWFRITKEHAQDIKEVVLYLKKEMNIPVWLLGLSAGTISVANGGVFLKNKIEGLILASSAMQFITYLPIEEIKVPTLILAHEKDACGPTDPEYAPQIKNIMRSSSHVEIKYLTGGSNYGADPCGNFTYHVFSEIEKKVITTIADFVKLNSQ